MAEEMIRPKASEHKENSPDPSVQELLKTIISNQHAAANDIKELRDRVNVLESGEYFDNQESQVDDHNTDHGNVHDISPNSNDDKTTDEFSHGESTKRHAEDIFSCYNKKFKMSENTGPKVNPQLALLADDLFTSGVEAERFNELKNNLKRPENVNFVQNVKVDIAIWQNLPPPPRTRDIAFQTVQTAIAKAGCGLIQLLEKIDNKLPVKEEIGVKEELIELGTEILASMGHAHYNLCLRRRDLLKSSLASDYRHLCSTTTPVNDNLFGGELEKTIDNITKANKVGSKLQLRKASSSNQSYKNQVGQSFRGRGRGRGQSYTNSSGYNTYRKDNFQPKNYQGRGKTYSK